MLATGRSIHSAFRTWNSTLLRPERERALARAAEHRLGLVGDDHPAHRRDQLRREHARLPQARRQLEHALARLRHGRVDHPVRDRGAELAHRALLARPAGGRLFPAAQARSRCCSGRSSSRSPPRRQPHVPIRAPCAAACPSGCAAAARATNDTCLGTLCAASVARAMGAQRLTVEDRPRPRHDDRRDGLAPALVGAGRRPPPRARRGAPPAPPRPPRARRSRRR